MNQGRDTRKLNLDWKFLRGDGPDAWYKGFDDSGWQTVAIPHDWSVKEPFSREHSSGTGYLPGGTGWYRKSFGLPEEHKGKKIYITFEGIYNNSQVWCNSYYIGKRPYGYSTFTYDITDFAAFGDTENVISVRADHRNVADSRWYTGSGIYRDVYLTVTDPIHFDNCGVFVTTPEIDSEHAALKVDIRISNETEETAAFSIDTMILDEDGNTCTVTRMQKELNGRMGTEACQVLRIGDPRFWSPESPHLYSVLSKIVKNGEILDEVKIPTGIRWFAFDAEKGFFLNGRNMKIKGVCVHHDAGCLGAAVPEKVWASRLTDLKAMGCNAIRTSHNPPAPYLLDLCDKMGFLVMDEAFDEWEGVKNKWSVGHNVYPPKHYGYYEDFPHWAETDIKDMVLRDRNHPSVILWSIGNEVDYHNDPYCHPLFRSATGNNDENKPAAERIYDPNKPNAERLPVISRRLVEYVRECDTTRPVTAAVALPELSNLTGYSDTLDIVGYNYKESLYVEDHRKYPDHVIYGSENSTSLEAWLAVRDNDFICGQFVWTGIDYLGEARGWPVRAAQSGFLDLAGYKKTEYYYRKSLWTAEPAAFLAARKKDGEVHENNPWNLGEPNWNWDRGERLEVFCYTNCEEAELFINGRSAGNRCIKDFPQQYPVWEVDFEEGTVFVTAKNSSGRGCSCELKTASKPEKLVMCSDSAELAADGQDIAIIDIHVTDGKGVQVYQADHLISLSVEGPGEFLGLENGDAADLEPYGSAQRKAYHGKLRAYLRTRAVPGKILIRAEAQGLETAMITLVSSAR